MFLQPEESNVELLRLYMQALLTEQASPRWSPLFYLIAVHHVNRFMYTTDGKHELLKRAMLKEAINCKNKVRDCIKSLG